MNMDPDTLISLVWALTGIIILLLFRNGLVLSIRTIEVDCIGEDGKHASQSYREKIVREFYEGPGYLELLLDPTVWSWEQVYGNEAREKRGLKRRTEYEY